MGGNGRGARRWPPSRHGGRRSARLRAGHAEGVGRVGDEVVQQRSKLVALAAVIVVLAGSCNYVGMARSAERKGEPVPWWCNPTEEIPVTDGPAAVTDAGRRPGPASPRPLQKDTS